MLKRGEMYEIPVSGMRAVVRVGTYETNGERLVLDLYVRKCGAGSALHMHPSISERLTVMSGRVGLSLKGTTSIVQVGSTIEISPGTAHRWWNAGIYEAQVRIDTQPAARFEDLMRNLIGLAQDGQTDAMGMPNLLQLAALAADFNDVIRFPTPSRLVRGPVFAMLAPIARLLGYRGSYSTYLTRPPAVVMENDTNAIELTDAR